MFINMEKMGMRRKRRKRNFLMSMKTSFPRWLYTRSRGGCSIESRFEVRMLSLRSVTYGDLVEGQRPNLACISEEAMEVDLLSWCPRKRRECPHPPVIPSSQDINFPEKFLEELECLENITSCNKVASRIFFLFKIFAGGKLSALQRVWAEPGRRDGRAEEQVPGEAEGRQAQPLGESGVLAGCAAQWSLIRTNDHGLDVSAGCAAQPESVRHRWELGVT